AVLLAHAELDGLVCSGPRRGRHHTYALLAERAPDTRRLDRDEALAELSLRYLTAHGPATERDLAYWATLTLADVRAGVEAVADRLERFEHDGRTYWHGDGPPARLRTHRAHLLQILDELYRGYQDSRWVLDADGLLSRGRETALGMAVLDGQVVGRVRRRVDRSAVRFDVEELRAWTPAERRRIERAAERYGRFLDLPAVVAVAA
ncbi:MAG TPA: crosslink repair DNA glycosylase YcaQ family protein, partial [Acidimicrobiales bacterium]|nr:crosslink repair DNA glycosylase YcaQ family protein [Acidimicrobiales bacterium]